MLKIYRNTYEGSTRKTESLKKAIIEFVKQKIVQNEKLNWSSLVQKTMAILKRQNISGPMKY